MSNLHIVGHVSAVGLLMLIGVPTNLAVIWIHTRKNSRLSQNKFPLILAIIDLLALLLALPLFPFSSRANLPDLQIGNNAPTYLQEYLAVWQMNNYLSTLLLASIDKLYAVSWPFKYKLKRKLFVKCSVICAFVVNPAWVAVIVSSSVVAEKLYFTIRDCYTVGFGLIFIITTGIYSMIIYKIIQNDRRLNQVGPMNITRKDSQRSVTSQMSLTTGQNTNRHHMVAVTQLVFVLLVYAVSFLSLALTMHDKLPTNIFTYPYYINHTCNFFIYLAVNKEFRKEAKLLVRKILRRETHDETKTSPTGTDLQAIEKY